MFFPFWYTFHVGSPGADSAYSTQHTTHKVILHINLTLILCYFVILYLFLLGQNKKTSLFPVVYAHLSFCHKLPHLQFLFGFFFKNQNEIAYFEVKLDKALVKNWKYFHEICFLVNQGFVSWFWLGYWNFTNENLS